jgi:uncharacterized membrane protein YozB (DUF420 family)
MREKTKEITISASIMLLGLVTLFYLIPAQVDVSEDFEVKSLSPAFFPELAAILIVLLSGILIVTWFVHRKDRAENEGLRESSGSEMTAGEEMRVVGAFIIAALYYLGFKYLGFLISTVICLAGMFLLQGGKRGFHIAALSVTVALGLFAFFHYVMKVYFPVGILFR